MTSIQETIQPTVRRESHTNLKALIGLVLFLSFPFLKARLDLSFVVSEVGMWWLLFAVIVSWVYFVEKRTVASIGWKGWTGKTVLAGVGLGLLMFVLFGVINVAIQAIGLELSQEVGTLVASQPWPILLLVVIRAAVVEEVLFRGYAFERLLELTGSKFLAVLLPLLVFTLAHLSWGVGHLVFVFLVGGVFGILYAAKRNLALLVVAHFTVDVLALMVLPLMLGS